MLLSCFLRFPKNLEDANFQNNIMTKYHYDDITMYPEFYWLISFQKFHYFHN